MYNFITRELEYELDMEIRVCSVAISANSRYLLVNRVDGETRMLDLDTRECVREFRGQAVEKFVIRASYGGANESFVLTGSEGMLAPYCPSSWIAVLIIIDGYIYIWHKETGQLIEKLLGHKNGCCTAISWSPTNPSMFASGGDDNKVRM